MAFEAGARENMGSDVYLHFTNGAQVAEVRGDSANSAALKELRDQGREHRDTLVARAGPATVARIGERCEIFVDTRKLQFFDPDTGQSIYDDRSAVPTPAASVIAG